MRPETPRPELTILMPCLNEAETIATCVKKASSYLSKSNIRGEILVADNGSTDGSREIAQGLGARNPLLSFIGRIFFRAELGDFHCGLRGFNTGAIRNLKLRSRGMEFASEMVVRCRLARMRIAEVPTTLKKDGRSRRPHLRTWRDGWRHLRFLLIFSPRWLFFYPGLALVLFGAAFSMLLLPGPVYITPNISLDIHTFLVSAVTILIGMQCISFAVIVRRYAAARGLLPRSKVVERYLVPLTLERVLVVALIIGLLGLGGMVWCVVQWADVGFGHLQYGVMIKILTVSIASIALALQLAFTAFLSAIIETEI